MATLRGHFVACMRFFPWKEQRFFVALASLPGKSSVFSLACFFALPLEFFFLHARVFFLGMFFCLALRAFSCLAARVFLHARCSFQLAYLSNATTMTSSDLNMEPRDQPGT
jgi:hypothetical protein